MDAFTANYGFVNADLAADLRRARARSGVRARRISRWNPNGPGLLGQALFLALSAKPEDTSLTGRGLFVREQFLCQHVPPPPAGVNTNLAPSTEAHPQTNRDRMWEHVTNPVCATCHNLIDPIGYGFEKFDAIGVRRDKYQADASTAVMEAGGNVQPPKTVTLTMDTKGCVAGIADSHFSSPRELGAVLAKTPQCQECMVKQYFRYTAGRMETAGRSSRRSTRSLERFRNSEFRFQELIIAHGSRAGNFRPTEGNEHVASNHQAH